MIRACRAGATFLFSLACCRPRIRKHCHLICDLATLQSDTKDERRFSAIGMISSMAEECGDPTVKLPKAISLCVPVGGIAGLFFVSASRHAMHRGLLALT